MAAGMKSHGFTVDDILATSWDRKLATDLAEEIGSCTGEKLGTLFEMRRFLALKGYRELLQLLRGARRARTVITRSRRSHTPFAATHSRGRLFPPRPSGPPPWTVRNGARHTNGFTPSCSMSSPNADCPAKPPRTL